MGHPMTQGSDTFEEPTNLEHAETLRAQLVEEIQGIQEQLGDKQRTTDTGRRLTSKEYWAWKKRAQHALNQKLAELRRVKNWIRERRPPLTTQEGPNDELRHLHNLYSILANLEAEDVEFETGELTQIDAAKDFLLRAGVPIQPTAA